MVKKYFGERMFLPSERERETEKQAPLWAGLRKTKMDSDILHLQPVAGGPAGGVGALGTENSQGRTAVKGGV